MPRWANADGGRHWVNRRQAIAG